ncbi:hypothetical protein BOX15_Mlig022958g3, partial [Macrostomum lignano]
AATAVAVLNTMGILLTLLPPVCAALACLPATAALQLPLTRLNFVAPAKSGLPVDSVQLFGQRGVFQLVNGSAIHGRPEAAYCLRLGVGTPRQNITAKLDTGSSDFVTAGAKTPGLDRWFDAKSSSSLVWQHQLVRTPYTTGFWEGHLATDVVSLPGPVPGPVRAAFSVAERSSGYFQAAAGAWQASVGLAFERLSNARTAAGGGNFADTLARQLGDAMSTGSPPVPFCLQLCGGDAGLGSFIRIGRANRTDMLYASVRWDWYYEVVIADIKVGQSSLGMDCKEYNMDKAILHSGVGDIRLPARVHARVAQQVGAQQPELGNRFFNGLGLLCSSDGSLEATKRLLDAFPSVTFSLVTPDNQTVDLELSPTQYLRPVVLGGSPAGNGSCFRFGIQSTSDGAILGATFLSGFLVEFDRAGRRIGFASSSCPEANSSSRVLGPRPYVAIDGPQDCAFFRADVAASTSVLRPAAVAMATVCAMCILPVCALFVWRQTHRRCRDSDGENDGETVQLVPA